MAKSRNGRLSKLIPILGEATDLNGCAIFDANGREIGVVHAVWADENDTTRHLLDVVSGGIQGIRQDRFFVPAEMIVFHPPGSAIVETDAQKVFASPYLDPPFVPQRDLEHVYRLYGLSPPWRGAPENLPAGHA